MDPASFGSIIKDLRKKKGWSLRVAAEKIGKIKYPYLSQLESGSGTPSEDLARRIARTYQTNEEDLIFAARRVSEQIRDIKKRFPNAARDYLK